MSSTSTSPEAPSMLPINLELKKATSHDRGQVEEAAAAVQLVLPTPVRIVESTSNRSILRNPLPPLLQELQRNGQLQELTITEQRRTLMHHQQNGKNVKEVSTATSSPPQHRDTGDTLAALLRRESVFSGCTIDKPTAVAAGQKPPSHRRTRKTISPNDPAKALTEMSVRGLNLFRYATVNAGTYQCVECVKEGVEKSFKNKYSFQRHAFLYHEGKQRKVFPCPVCGKEFSRPDKMKNHLRMMHESNEAKVEAGLPSPGVMAVQHSTGEVAQLNPLPQSPYQPQYHQAEITNPTHQHEHEAARRRRRQQQEQDVMQIRSVVNAINLRQLQQLQQHAQELRMRHSLEEQNRQKAAKQQQVMEEPPPPPPQSVPPVQLVPLNIIGRQ
uniref:Uncharacterized protein n=2 Tax=Anopheles stephensi TaxID=30069 RepID=A0A182YLJ5_ANOST